VHLALAKASAADPDMLCSAARSWNGGVRARRGALYALIHAAILEQAPGRADIWRRCGGGHDTTSVEADLQVVVGELRDWPLDWLDWPARNCHREDVNLRHLIDGKAPSREAGRNQTTRILPINERTFFDWSNDPFACGAQGDGPLFDGVGSAERYPGVWLLPFWMARYHNFIAAPEE
jgi:hypothetical protein